MGPGLKWARAQVSKGPSGPGPKGALGPSGPGPKRALGPGVPGPKSVLGPRVQVGPRPKWAWARVDLDPEKRREEKRREEERREEKRREEPEWAKCPLVVVAVDLESVFFLP